MFKDMELSKDFMLNFKQHLTTLDSPSTIDMAVNILTMVMNAEKRCWGIIQLRNVFTKFVLPLSLQFQGSLAHLHPDGGSYAGGNGQISRNIQAILSLQVQREEIAVAAFARTLRPKSRFLCREKGTAGEPRRDDTTPFCPWWMYL